MRCKKSKLGRYFSDRRILTPCYSVLIAQPDEIVEPEDTAEGQELYFEVLELQPIQLAISFMRTERVSSEEQ